MIDLFFSKHNKPRRAHTAGSGISFRKEPPRLIIVVAVGFFLIFGIGQQLRQAVEVVIRQAFFADVLNHLVEGADELAEVFLIEEELVLFVAAFFDALALGDGDEKVLARARRLDVEKVGAFAGRDSARVDLVAVATAWFLVSSPGRMSRVIRIVTHQMGVSVPLGQAMAMDETATRAGFGKAIA